VEKLLRSCNGIKNIYLLIRPKRNQDINSRLEKIICEPLFDKLRDECPNVLNKIIPILGDITSEDLGISATDREILIREVSIVFHSAATIRVNRIIF
jgi:fatty acyl-CoA reductase